MTFTADGRNDHVTMFSLHLPLAVFTFLVKLSTFAIASKCLAKCFALVSTMYSFFQENINANLTFAVCRKQNRNQCFQLPVRKLDLLVSKFQSPDLNYFRIESLAENVVFKLNHKT